MSFPKPMEEMNVRIDDRLLGMTSGGICTKQGRIGLGVKISTVMTSSVTGDGISLAGIELCITRRVPPPQDCLFFQKNRKSKNDDFIILHW